MKRYLVGLALVGSAFAFWSCSGETGSSNNPRACNSDVDCGADICNTVGHVCMKGCSQASDCTDTSRDCKFITDSAGNNATSTKVCQCQTDQLCGGGTAYCHPVDKLCEVKCSDSSGCQGFAPARSCVSSQCAVPGGTTGGTDGGGGTDAGPTCNLATQATDCVVGNPQNYTYYTCNGTACGNCTNGVGPTTNCGWGDQCNNGGPGVCGPIGLDTCNRASSAPPFNPAAGGPLITAISATHSSTSDVNTECADGLDKIDIQITFVAGPNGLTNHSGQQDFLTNHVRYINSSGNVISPAYAHGYSGIANQQNGTFTVGLCGATSISGGAVFLRDESQNVGNVGCFST